ncbi:hypothetical protein HMN09_01060000 [Mycena chlorophos]|uniref:Thaumatin-like protein n=1 Tax=Mycena chlorophos TaxID=658473 RepID=A0A8H6SD46_MYCCL|nr:hypothetical protein HMN09_01060000 [Mycena chlorophos]
MESLIVDNLCAVDVYLYTQTSFGKISNGDVILNAGQTGHNMAFRLTGTAPLASAPVATARARAAPLVGRATPFSRAEFNFYAIPGSVTYDISLIYGFNVGMKITSAEASCAQFSCSLGELNNCQCPVPGPDPTLNDCYSPCCSSVAECAGGALPEGGGGCVNNAGPGPNSPYYYNNCPNAYAFPDNDGADGYTRLTSSTSNTCNNAAITLTLCPGTTSHLTRRTFSEPEVEGKRGLDIARDEA